MNKKIISLLALALGLAAPAVAQPVVLTNNITEVAVSDATISPFVMIVSAGSNYTINPTVTVTGGGGVGATATAVETNGSVTSVTITPGMGYTGAPVLTFSGGQMAGSLLTPSQATATAFLNFPPASDFKAPFQNEVYGIAGHTIGLISLSAGTQPAAGFTYSFTANGLSIGQTPMPAPPGTPAGIVFDPPLPGIYTFVSTTHDDDGNTAVSPPIRYFATGTAIISPEASGTPPLNAGQGGIGPGSLVPLGSSVIIQAVSTPKDGFVSRVDFYTDWTGAVAGSTLIGSATSNFSVIYSPAGPVGTAHLVKALAYDNLGVLVPSNNNLDQITLTVTTANPGALPTCQLITPENNALLQIPAPGGSGTSGIPVIISASASSGAMITKVEFYVNGTLTGTAATFPYTFFWNPTTTGIYSLTALAYDNLGNVVASSSVPGSGTPVPTKVTIEGPPEVAITSPDNGGAIGTGSLTGISAVVVDNDTDKSGNPVTIQEVDFFQDGVLVGSTSTPLAGTHDYTIAYKPTQKFDNGQVVPSLLTVQATDSLGFTGISPNVTVNITAGGGGNSIVQGTPPTIRLLTPAANANVIVNSPVTFSASAAAANGNVSEVDFLVNGSIVKSLTSYPYSTTFTFTNLGNYRVSAQVIDNLGDKTLATSVNIAVVGQPPPTIAITSPTSGGILTTGSGVTVTAAANSPSGTISSVQFFENGISLGTVNSPPYQETFNPLSAGIYTLTAIATDSAGETTMSAPAIVEAEPAQAGLGTTIYFGQYQGLTEGGRFAFITVDGKFGTFISHSSLGTTATNVLYSDLTVSPTGSFSGTHLSGSASASGVSGNLIPSQDLFIGAAASAGLPEAGYYTGSLTGKPDSTVTVIVGGDGSLMAYVSTGNSNDVADGSIDSTGAFTITTTGNNTFSGSIDPTTDLLTGTLTGPTAGSILAARVSGGTFSDGVLRNLSTRGEVGTGSNLMVAGFVVGGTAPKQLLIRAVGPTLGTFGLSGSIPGTVLQVFSGTTMVASNTGWSSTPSNKAAVANADAQVGAFALPTGSADSALVATFAPGSYTAQVTGGAGGSTGLALAEVYDLDVLSPFTAQRLINVSTRGTVGSGSSVLIAGFSFNGTAPKRLLIRGVGPALSGFGVANALSAAHLQIYNSAQKVIRENYSWQTGNDAGLITAAASATGAFALANGSADSVILITLAPGTYTAEVSGATTSDTGVGMVEVYEVP